MSLCFPSSSLHAIATTSGNAPVPAEQGVNHRFPEEHAVGEVEDAGPLRVREVLEADGVADFVSEDGPYLFCDPCRYRGGGNAARLSAADAQAVVGPALII